MNKLFKPIQLRINNMISILIVEQNGTIKQVKSKDLSRDILYKKCGFRSNENFDRTAVWTIDYNKELVNIELWAKNEGKANNENKYDFPPPVDNALYYGSCALIRVDSKGAIVDLSTDLWLRLYEKLFGGFEDIEDEEEDVEDEEEEEEDDEEEVVKTKNGYVKDDFVIDDEEDEDEEGEDEEDDNVDVSVKNKKKTKVVEEEEEEDYYGSELEEEAYSYSDEE
uniref:Uncharacterized protein n=1 Tax=viral metagenome TaxID=1070528 RepID=A0A6C0IJC8_9ZZZZ